LFFYFKIALIAIFYFFLDFGYSDYEDMNAYFIKSLSEKLKQKFGQQVEYIATENKGYRANGQRHPHAWAIVAIPDLLAWMLSE